MTRWEYMIVRADWYTGGLMVNSPVTNKLVKLDSYLAELGADGWEAVAMQHAPNVPSGGKLLFLLKRPMAEQ
jgi:hypothetical protein